MSDKVNLTIKATNTKLTPDVRRLVEQKFSGLAKFVRPHKDQEIRLAAEVGRKNKAQSKGADSFFAELNIIAGGQRHRAVATAPDLRVAVDQVKREMTAHLSRSHEKGKDIFEKGGRVMKEVMHSDFAPPSEIDLMVEEEAAKILAAPMRKLVVKRDIDVKVVPKRNESKKVKKVTPKKQVVKKLKGPKHGTKNTRGAKNRPPRKISPKRKR